MANSPSKSTTSSGKGATRRNSRGSQSETSNGLPFRKPPWSKAYSFALVTGALFLFSWLGQFIFQMITERNEAEQHGQSFSWSDFFPQFFESTLENWQSEFLQLFSFVVLASLFIHKGSAESKDSDEQMQKSLDRIEKRLKALEGGEKADAKSS